MPAAQTRAATMNAETVGGGLVGGGAATSAGSGVRAAAGAAAATSRPTSRVRRPERRRPEPGSGPYWPAPRPGAPRGFRRGDGERNRPHRRQDEADEDEHPQGVPDRRPAGDQPDQEAPPGRAAWRRPRSPARIRRVSASPPPVGSPVRPSGPLAFGVSSSRSIRSRRAFRSAALSRSFWTRWLKSGVTDPSQSSSAIPRSRRPIRSSRSAAGRKSWTGPDRSRATHRLPSSRSSSFCTVAAWAGLPRAASSSAMARTLAGPRSHRTRRTASSVSVTSRGVRGMPGPYKTFCLRPC